MQAPQLPAPRGPLSALVTGALREAPFDIGEPTVPHVGDPLADEDLQLTLYVAYELHYRGFDAVDARWEWEPSLLRLRRELEEVFWAAVLDEIGERPRAGSPSESDVALRAILESDDAPSISTLLSREGTREQMLEFLIHRSAYQLKEADPHSFAIPRLTGEPKAAIVEIQADEYGGGRADRIHAVLFAATLRAVGLDDRYGFHLDRIPAPTLAAVNLVSMFGLHRRLRGCAVGHLAAFEMSSSIPSRRYADGLRRLGWPQATPFFDEHVEADAVHENIAAVNLAGGLMRTEPQLADDVLLGAAALLAVDGRWAEFVTERWSREESSLLEPSALAPAGA
ncbi:iron-containing redox enzyme family protein [Thermoleophilia bacterium SCSIO 60948]|nr:iron-containing redox enzyme family protein [Thermoleophilia bacterium SCSIO 60948]